MQTFNVLATCIGPMNRALVFSLSSTGGEGWGRGGHWDLVFGIWNFSRRFPQKQTLTNHKRLLPRASLSPFDGERVRVRGSIHWGRQTLADFIRQKHFVHRTTIGISH
jgi:hypothetical protein